MSSVSNKTKVVVWGGLILVILTIVFAFIREQSQRRGAGASGETQVSGLDGTNAIPPVISKVADFKLINQFSQAVSLADLAGHIWVADIIFTRCPGPCATLTRNMRKIQQSVSGYEKVKFVSLTADPEYDTPKVLQAYATQFGAATNNWVFLTGPKKEIYELAIKSLLVTVQEKRPEEIKIEDDLFLHDVHFVVVDSKGQVRGYFDGTTPESVQGVSNLIKLLQREGAH